MNLAVEAGRLVYESGRMLRELYAAASGPLGGLVGT
jgi:thiazole synthase ThiGH ThiG subunit